MRGPAAGGADPAIAAAIAALGLERPEVTPLAGGLANRSYRLREGPHDLVLRVPGPRAPGLGADRHAEIAMQSLAAVHGLAPPLVLAGDARRFIVSRFAPGRAPSAAVLREPQLLRRIGAWMARLHALEPPDGLPAVDFGARAAAYLARVAGHAPGPQVTRLQHELAGRRTALDAPPRLTPCHHDLHRRNLLDDGERLVAVDWEYAGPGDPAADLAACIGYNRLGRAQREALLSGYGASGSALATRVTALAWIFDCLWFGWNAAAALDGLAPDPQVQARLAARLAR